VRKGTVRTSMVSQEGPYVGYNLQVHCQEVNYQLTVDSVEVAL
jgi:hypothetical protein